MKSKQISRSFFRKIATIFSLLVVVIIAMVIWLVLQSRDSVEQQIKSNLQQELYRAHVLLEHEVDSVKYFERIVNEKNTIFVDMLEYDNHRAISILLQYMASINQYDALILIEAGSVVATSRIDLEKTIQDQNLLQHYEEKDPSIRFRLLPSSFFSSLGFNLNDDPRLMYNDTGTYLVLESVHKLEYIAGETAGHLVSLQIIYPNHPLMKSFGKHASTLLYFTDSHGDLLVSNDQKTMRKILDNENNQFTGKYRQQQRQITNGFRDSHISYGIAIDMDKYDERLNQLYINNILPIFAGLIIFYILAWLVRTRIIISIKNLGKTLDNIFHGDMKARFTWKQSAEKQYDEIDVLGLQFNQMMNALENSYSQLERINSITAAINSETDFDLLINRILEETYTVGPFVHATAFVLDSDTHDFVCPASIITRASSKAHQHAKAVSDSSLRSGALSAIKKQIKVLFDDKTSSNVGNIITYVNDDKMVDLVSIGGEPYTHEFILPICMDGNIAAYLVYFAEPGEEYTEEQITELLSSLKDHLTAAFIKTRLLNRLEQTSYTDALTGCHNRHYLNEVINQIISNVARENSKNLALNNEITTGVQFIMIDLDHFKSVNDTFGHNAGDAVLKQTAERLRSCCRQSDLLIRWGGEEFLLVALNVDNSGLSSIPEKICNSLRSAPFVLDDGNALHKTCSIGFSWYRHFGHQHDDIDWLSIVELADTALYAIKNTQRDGWAGLSATNLMRSKEINSAISSGIGDKAKEEIFDITTSLDKPLIWNH